MSQKLSHNKIFHFSETRNRNLIKHKVGFGGGFTPQNTGFLGYLSRCFNPIRIPLVTQQKFNYMCFREKVK